MLEAPKNFEVLRFAAWYAGDARGGTVAAKGFALEDLRRPMPEGMSPREQSICEHLAVAGLWIHRHNAVSRGE
jgi:hypothetical protein